MSPKSTQITTSDVLAILGILAFVGGLLVVIFSGTESVCHKQLARAKNSTDSAVVYASRPIPNGPTCSVVE